jgi:hypothetical protein
MSFVLLGILNAQAAGGGGAVPTSMDLLRTDTFNNVNSFSYTGLDTYASDYRNLHISMKWNFSIADRHTSIQINDNNNQSYNYWYANTFSGEFQAQQDANDVKRTVYQRSEPPTNERVVMWLDLVEFSNTNQRKNAQWWFQRPKAAGAFNIGSNTFDLTAAINKIAFQQVDTDGTTSGLYEDVIISLYGSKETV